MFITLFEGLGYKLKSLLNSMKSVDIIGVSQFPNSKNIVVYIIKPPTKLVLSLKTS